MKFSQAQLKPVKIFYRKVFGILLGQPEAQIIVNTVSINRKKGIK